MKINEVLARLERDFPLAWQEDFDNCGVQVGDKEQDITGALVCFELKESVIEEAIRRKTNLVISHHPLIFQGVKKIEPTNRVGRIICKALAHHIVIYSMHTNVDSGIGGGNDVLAQKLQLQNLSVLAPKEDLFRKLVFFVPSQDAARVCQALFDAGCGTAGNYDRCTFTVPGEGSFRPLAGAHPYSGFVNEVSLVEEHRIEMIFPVGIQKRVVNTLYAVHPYEEPAFDIYQLHNKERKIGLGRVGSLPEPMSPTTFMDFIKQQLQVSHLRFSGDRDKLIKRVAVCGGAGASLIRLAMAASADAYVTGDVKYHDFLTTDNQMLMVDVGHFEGEHFIKEIIYNKLKKNFSNFATSIIEDEVSDVNFY